MAHVLNLPVEERPVLDPARLGYLNRQLGLEVADNVICSSMEELALRLAAIERQHRAGDWDILQKSTRSLANISDHLGLTTLHRVAQDVLTCLSIGDRTALAATIARLLRSGMASMSAVWDHQESCY